MDHRSWIWGRNLSEKSPGETESSGGSMSSHSERFSDDQIYSNRSSVSPEVTSKAGEDEVVEDVVKTLSQKLSDALLKISIKEDLVKEHSKVAEEAVEGLEKAEKEVLALRRQVEVLTLRNSTLQDRVCHLDGALKECLRQLRQTRDKKDEKIDEAMKKKTSEWQTTKAGLEKQLSDLRSQLQTAKNSETLLAYIERTEKENSALKLELASMAEELEMRFIERELSKQAADEASKLHLESAKKAAKLEGECCRLNAALRKALATNDQKSSTDSQSKVESDAYKEKNEFKRNRKSPSKAINLMDDFLEMERLVALPKSAPRDSSEVEEVLKRVEMEKRKLEITLNERENELKASRNELKEVETKLAKMEALLINANDAKETTEKELESVKAIVNTLKETVKRSKLEFESQLDIECNERKEAESRLEDAYTKKNEAESRFNTLEAELESLIPKVNYLEAEVKKEHALSGKLGAKCQELEAELESLIPEVNSFKTEVEKERALSGTLGATCQELEAELGSLMPKVVSLEAEVEKERALSGMFGAKCQELEAELGSLMPKVDSLNAEVEKERALSGKLGAKCKELEAELESLISKVDSLETAVEKERSLSGKLGSKCQELEAELDSLIPKVDSLETEVGKERALSGKLGARCRELEAELESLILKVDHLETEVEKERDLSKKWGVKSMELEGEISRLQRENQYPKPPILNAELRTTEDTELASARCKFADCQQTIASLGKQLKTLATLEDFLIDTNEFSRRI